MSTLSTDLWYGELLVGVAVCSRMHGWQQHDVGWAAVQLGKSRCPMDETGDVGKQQVSVSQ